MFAADCPAQFLHVIDILDPSLPFILGSATTSSHGTYQHRLAVEGRRVIALRGGNSEVIVDAFDIAGPTTPAHLGRWSGWARTSAAQGGFGRAMSYRLDSKALGRELKEEETLSQAGIPQNDRLMMTADVTTG